MLLKIKGNPYIDCMGIKSPHLAGREGEKGMIEIALDRIMGQPDEYGRLDGVSPPLVLIGPRGVGKTVLLDWTERKAETLGVQSVVLSEKLLGGPRADLAQAVLGKERHSDVASGSTSTLNVGNAAIFGNGANEQTTAPATVLNLRSILEAQLEVGPLLVILDEAHAVAPELLKEFNVAIQEFVQGCRPLAVVIVGTPGLRKALSEFRATYLESSEFMSLNSLATEEASEALSTPVAETGVPIDEDALEALVEWTDCYPFFIQLAGMYSWEIAKMRGASGITLEDANTAIGAATRKRRECYNGRFQELINLKIVPNALQVIDLFIKQPGQEIDYMKILADILELNKEMEYERAVEIIQQLVSLGFIYDNGERYEAGIPSLFDYVREKGLV